MFNLTIIKPDGRKRDQQFDNETTVLGRNEDCDLRLVDGLVSRHHCLILQEGKRFIVKDLKSRNGTWINGRRINNRKEVRNGDVIQVGAFRILFNFELPPGMLFEDWLSRNFGQDEDLAGVTRESDSPIEPLGMISSYLSEATGHYRQVPTKIRRERIYRNLLTLYRIIEELVTPDRDLDDILEYMIEEIFEIFAPSQATVLLVGEDQVAYPAKQKAYEGEDKLRPVSSTIQRQVLEEMASVLTDDAAHDPSFNEIDSVILDDIRSVMAAPICSGETVLGMLYVDKVGEEGGYENEDLDLLTSMGRQAALAIQRSRLTERIREEAVKNAVMRQALGRFHSPPVVDLILQGAADLEAKETVATILFCDIAHFTAICEKTSPSQLQELLNLFFKTVNDVVFEEQGTLDKYIGDGALSIFGAPLPQKDSAARAIKTAIKIRDLLSEAQKEAPEELRFQVRYGINTGSAIVGNFGSDQRMDYTILGHTVNLASRICENAEPDQILIGASSYQDLKKSGLFKIREIGAKQFKGIKEKEHLYEIRGFL
jgi:adenylate cyclase